MRFDVITLMPELFAPFTQTGVTRRAFASGGPVQLRLWNPRDFATGGYRRVDDRPFGGGPGMVMMAEPLAQCLAAICADREQNAIENNVVYKKPRVILFSPAGRKITQCEVQFWAQGAHGGDGAVLLCGRYEGIDQRFIDTHVSDELSLGDFVLSGGELPALALLDALARLLPGVLGDADSHAHDSFAPTLDGLLDCPHYTRPEVWAGQATPPVLLGGNHAAIAQWRRQQRLALTGQRRPELLQNARAAGHLSAADEAYLREIRSPAATTRHAQRLRSQENRSQNPEPQNPSGHMQTPPRSAI